jgi:hypothetical protein
MHSLFEDRPGVANMVKIGILLFLTLSMVSLYYQIKVNRALDKKLNGTT